MDCKEFEKMIPEFLEQKMDFLSITEFKEHLSRCPNCREELEIQFLVTEGMQRLEEGDAFALRKELHIRTQEADKKVRFHRGFLKLGAVLEVMAVIIIGMCVISILA